MVIHEGEVVIHEGEVVIHEGEVVIHEEEVVIHEEEVVIHEGEVVIHEGEVVIHEKKTGQFLHRHKKTRAKLPSHCIKHRYSRCYLWIQTEKRKSNQLHRETYLYHQEYSYWHRHFGGVLCLFVQLRR